MTGNKITFVVNGIRIKNVNDGINMVKNKKVDIVYIDVENNDSGLYATLEEDDEYDISIVDSNKVGVREIKKASRDRLIKEVNKFMDNHTKSKKK